MKKVIIFIGLKVIETSVIIFLPYFLGKLLSKWDWYYISMDFINVPYWVVGFLSLVMLLVVTILISVLCVAIHKNWLWATKIANNHPTQTPTSEG